MSKKHERSLVITQSDFHDSMSLHVMSSELAEALGDLRYDGLAEYLSALADKLQSDSENDGGRGRGKLAEHLSRAAFALDEAKSEILEAWKICKPYMKAQG